MAEVEARLEELGIVLPERLEASPGLRLPFSWVRMHGSRAYVSGHSALNPDGSVARPLGKVGAEVSPEQGYEAARLTALAILASLRRELGDLDRVTPWLRVFGMVNAAPASPSNPTSSTGIRISSWKCTVPRRAATPAQR